jgi:hypothetical protein
MKSFISIQVILISLVLLFSGCQKETVQGTLNPPVANAGSSVTIQLPVNNTTLIGSGTTENGHITGYLWSLVSGPNVPVIVSPGSPSTAINTMIAGTYIFQLMVIDNAGLTGIDTATILVRTAIQQTITLQPATNTANEINFAGNNSGSNGSAHDIDLDAEAWTSGGNPLLIRGAFKFDLSSIPSTSTIVSAKLSLYSNPTPINGDQINANSGSNNAMFIRRINSSWSGITATWQTQPTTTTTDQILIAHTNLSTLDLTDIDVTSLVTTMLTTSNYGFMMMLQNEVTYNTRQFCSSNHTAVAKRPKLVVVYQ